MANPPIIDEIRQAIESLDYGSVEVIVQNGEITQISTRIIKKTNVKQTQPGQKIAGAVVQKRGGSGININFKY
ncbi:MAG: DUF2292 domain-containing protein [Patescibacteria group bacterium]